MKQTAWPGTILMKEGTLLPETLQLETEAFSNGWKLIKNFDASGLDRRIHAEYWTFFYLASEISATCLGFGGQNMERRVVKRLLAKAKSTKFNSIDISRMVSNSFLGVPYTTVFAHARHLQKDLVLLRDESLLEPNGQNSPVLIAPGAGSPQSAVLPLKEPATKPGLAPVANF